MDYMVSGWLNLLHALAPAADRRKVLFMKRFSGYVYDDCVVTESVCSHTTTKPTNILLPLHLILH